MIKKKQIMIAMLFCERVQNNSHLPLSLVKLDFSFFFNLDFGDDFCHSYCLLPDSTRE